MKEEHLLGFEFIALNATDKAVVLNRVLCFFTLISECSESVDDDTEDDIEHHDNNDHEETQIKEVATPELVAIGVQRLG